MNFGFDAHLEHGLRYDRAAEFHDIVRGLWDSWEDDAFLRDKASGQWFDPEKMHILNHEGKHFRVRGPMNVSRSPQGRPVSRRPDPRPSEWISPRAPPTWCSPRSRPSPKELRSVPRCASAPYATAARRTISGFSRG